MNSINVDLEDSMLHLIESITLSFLSSFEIQCHTFLYALCKFVDLLGVLGAKGSTSSGKSRNSSSIQRKFGFDSIFGAILFNFHTSGYRMFDFQGAGSVGQVHSK